jgi:hypothetical protein
MGCWKEQSNLWWTHILPCAIEVHVIIGHVKVHTQTISIYYKTMWCHQKGKVRKDFPYSIYVTFNCDDHYHNFWQFSVHKLKNLTSISWCIVSYSQCLYLDMSMMVASNSLEPIANSTHGLCKGKKVSWHKLANNTTFAQK